MSSGMFGASMFDQVMFDSGTSKSGGIVVQSVRTVPAFFINIKRAAQRFINSKIIRIT